MHKAALQLVVIAAPRSQSLSQKGAPSFSPAKASPARAALGEAAAAPSLSLTSPSDMPRETPDAYLSRQSVTPTFSELLEGCCRDLPETTDLSAYLLYKLKERFPAAVKGIDIPAEAIAWKPKDLKVYNKVQLHSYLQDLRWGQLTAAILERVLYERPKNAPAFIIQLLAKGDIAPPDTGEEAAQAALDAAAAKVQAIQRGHMTRKERQEQQRAATKVQAAKRGSQARKDAAGKRRAVEEEQGAAATKMQARQRGRTSRKMQAEVEYQGAADADQQMDSMTAEMQEEQEEQDAMAYLMEDPAAAASATKMQAIQRGRQSRRK